jgi:hypothetical protein
MAPKEPANPTIPASQPASEAAIALQTEILDAYQKAGDAWLARVKSEVDFWSDLSTKLTATRSVPEALENYTKFVSQRMQMTADDGRRLFNDCQKITQKIALSLSKGWPTGSA